MGYWAKNPYLEDEEFIKLKSEIEADFKKVQDKIKELKKKYPPEEDTYWEFSKDSTLEMFYYFDIIHFEV